MNEVGCIGAGDFGLMEMSFHSFSEQFPLVCGELEDFERRSDRASSICSGRTCRLRRGSVWPRRARSDTAPPRAPRMGGLQEGTGPRMRGQGPSLDPTENVAPWNSPDAHWPIR